MGDQPQYELFEYSVKQTGKGPALEFKRNNKAVKTLPQPAGMQGSEKGTAWVLFKEFQLISFTEVPEIGYLIGTVVGITKEYMTLKLDETRTTQFPVIWGPSIANVHLYDKAWVRAQNQLFFTLPVGMGESSCMTGNQMVSTAQEAQTQPAASQTAFGQSDIPSAPPIARKPHFDITEEEKAAFHSPCRETERNEEIPTTIGRHRLPITKLSSLFKWNQLMVNKFEGLFRYYGAWRRSRGDGNCFYRCLGVLFFEHLFRSSTTIGESRHFYEQIVGQQDHFMLLSQSEDGLKSVKTLCHMIKDLYSLKGAAGNAFQTLQYHLQKPAIDKAIIVSMRTYTASYLWHHQGDEDIAPFLENVNILYNQILNYGEEAEGLALKIAARTLNVVIYIQTVDNKSENVSITKYGPLQPGCYPAIHMLHLPGHYNYLIPQDVHEADQYNFEANTYSGQASQRIIGYEQFVPET